MKIIKGNLVLTKDTTFDESIIVEGNITCKGGRWNLNVNGDIDSIDIHARNIDAYNVDARDIHANDIHANDIHAGDIHALDIIARNIYAGDIICDKRIKKHKDPKTIAFGLVTDRFSRECKEQMPEAE